MLWKFIELSVMEVIELSVMGVIELMLWRS